MAVKTHVEQAGAGFEQVAVAESTAGTAKRDLRNRQCVDSRHYHNRCIFLIKRLLKHAACDCWEHSVEHFFKELTAAELCPPSTDLELSKLVDALTPRLLSEGIDIVLTNITGTRLICFDLISPGRRMLDVVLFGTPLSISVANLHLLLKEMQDA